MGDRRNVAVQCYGKRIYLYTHWSGSDVPQLLHKALARRQRWDDGPYLTRIIFCTMLEGDIDGETGFGISTEKIGGNHSTVVVDVDNQTIGIDSSSTIFSFEEFVTKHPELDIE